LDLKRKEIDGSRVKQLAETLKTNQVTTQSAFIDSLTLVLNVLQFLGKLNMQRNSMNPEEIQYLAETLKINKVTQYCHLAHFPEPLSRLTDANGVESSTE
jgi:GGDEF domain-containing protein